MKRETVVDLERERESNTFREQRNNIVQQSDTSKFNKINNKGKKMPLFVVNIKVKLCYKHLGYNIA